ncbi:hypothetical protein BX616_001758, partial [Lobosporangium transversale]
ETGTRKRKQPDSKVTKPSESKSRATAKARLNDNEKVKHVYTEEQDEFLAEKLSNECTNEVLRGAGERNQALPPKSKIHLQLAMEFNEQYGASLNAAQIKNKIAHMQKIWKERNAFKNNHTIVSCEDDTTEREESEEEQSIADAKTTAKATKLNKRKQRVVEDTSRTTKRQQRNHQLDKLIEGLDKARELSEKARVEKESSKRIEQAEVTRRITLEEETKRKVEEEETKRRAEEEETKRRAEEIRLEVERQKTRQLELQLQLELAKCKRLKMERMSGPNSSTIINTQSDTSSKNN